MLYLTNYEMVYIYILHYNLNCLYIYVSLYVYMNVGICFKLFN